MQNDKYQLKECRYHLGPNHGHQFINEPGWFNVWRCKVCGLHGRIDLTTFNKSKDGTLYMEYQAEEPVYKCLGLEDRGGLKFL